MSQPVFENTKIKFEKNLKMILNQAVTEFQENNEVTFDSILIELEELRKETLIPVKQIKQIKIHLVK
jgi:hypothetical protein